MKRLFNFIKVAVRSSVGGHYDEDEAIEGIQKMAKDLAWTYFIRGMFVGGILIATAYKIFG